MQGEDKHLNGCEIAIIGMAFRFPGDLSDESSFWDALREKKDLVGCVPPDRWATTELQHAKRSELGRSITFSAGVLSRVDEFDAEFFGISPREAAWLDPQQRLLLELAWEALENAGVRPSSLAGSDCAVYVGASSLDYGTRALDDLSSVTSNFMTGNTLSMAANRLSYVFDLHGPSLAVDTACSSSLVALHHACNSLHSGEASTALVGGVSLLLHPYPFVGFTKASMLSAGGRCKAFDKSGDGYVRSEGGAVLLLKPLKQALADSDEIHAVILASGVNADGARKTGITIPSSDGQAELMRQVLARSGLSAHDIDYIEAHGTGTAVGDPIEASAIGRVYGQGRAQALPIGSVKANLGHLEPASGMAGLVKTLLVLKNRAMPPALHLHTPNPQIDFKELNLELVKDYKSLMKSGDRPLVAGVNSFGFGGANAHVLLRSSPRLGVQDCASNESSPPLFLSARTDAALRSLAGRYVEFLQDSPSSSFYDVAHTSVNCRDRLNKRLVVHQESPEEVLEFLRQYAEGESPSQVVVEDGLPDEGGVAFVYSGNGAQWFGMGRRLLNESVRFEAIIDQLDAAMQPLSGFSLRKELLAEQTESRLDDTVIAQPLLFAIQVAITLLLKELGIEPRAVTGHSVGEIAAAWAAGALDLDNAIRVICARSQAQGLTRGAGRMAAVGMSVESAREMLVALGGNLDVELAGINSPGNVTLTGSLDGLIRIQAHVEPQGVFFRLLDLDYAFHSRQMDAVREKLVNDLAGLSAVSTDKTLFVSTVTGSLLDGRLLVPDYWWRNVREPVRFAEAIAALAEHGCRVFVEISPHAILQRYVGESLNAADIKGRVIPTLRKEDDGLDRIADAALRAQLLVDRPQLNHYFPHSGQRVRLPNYPWQKERYWHPKTTEAQGSFERSRVHPLLGWRLHDAEVSWENILDTTILPWLADHKVGGAVVFPGAAYAEMALAAAREWLGGERFAIEQIDIVSPMVLDGEHARTLRLIVNPRDGGFQIKSRQRLSIDEWTLHAAGRILQSSNRPAVGRIAIPPTIKSIEHDEHYRLAFSLGLDYGPAFQGFRDACVGESCLEARLDLPEDICPEEYLLHPALLDVCFQSLVDFCGDAIKAGQGIALLPTKVGRLDLFRSGQPIVFRARLLRRSTRSVLASFELLDDNGELLASVSDCRFRAAPLKLKNQHKVASWNVALRMQPHPEDERAVALPGVRELLEELQAGFSGMREEREAWFKETLPLFEALILAFAYEAFQKLAQEHPDSWWHGLVKPYGDWLTNLLMTEGLLEKTDTGWTLADDTDLPPADELWRSLIADTPACLPKLTLLGRVGRHLPQLLSGALDGPRFLDELRHSAAAEELYNNDPTYRGTHFAAKTVLRHLARELSPACRLRVLEISAGPSELPKALFDTLPEDRFDYVLAVSSDEVRVRQQAEYHEQSNVIVAALDETSWALDADRPLPDLFDLVILRHSLHRANHPRGRLTQAKRWLASGGVLLLTERHPDWSADFFHGLDRSWWHEASGDSDVAVRSSLHAPEVWRQAIGEEGFEDSEIFTEPAADGLSEGAYALIARRPLSETVPEQSPAAASWGLYCDDTSRDLADRLCHRLESAGQSVELRYAVDRDFPESVNRVVCLLGWGENPDSCASTLTNALKIAQTLGARTENVPRLWIVTRGGALTKESPVGALASPVQSALWGFGRVVMNEIPALNCTLIDLLCDLAAVDTLARLENELLRPNGDNEIVLSPDARYCPVMREEAEHPAVAARQGDRYRLDFHVPGQLRNLVWLPAAERPLGDEEIEVRTQATGLNFRDVMYLMGLLPDEVVENGFAGASLGLEFSGEVTRVGSRVKGIQAGDSVMGLGGSCFASHVVTAADAVVRMPVGWSFEAAATVPTVFLTVYYAFKQLADLQPGEKVLIHGAAGGVGIAAIQLARHLGAEIYATAGSDEKRDFVRLLGADRVFDSRSLSFADDIFVATEGEGVDVVLNSLAGEAMRRSLDVLKPFGRFLELGKRDFVENTPIGLRPLKNNISYFGIDADQLQTQRPRLAAKLFNEMVALFREGVLSPLPYRVFSADRIVDAFRVMQQARHIGKIVVSMTSVLPRIERPQPRLGKIVFHKQATWLVTGGLSGFGLDSARWLAARGVGNLVLVGRRGMDTPGAAEIVNEFSAQGVNVLALACDIADGKAVNELIERVQETMPPLKGVLHAAAVFDDRLIINLDAQSMEDVLHAKLVGAWNLHQATLDVPLEHFVLYSSITTAIGNPGQANYVAANAGLEGLAQLRRNTGLPATCIAWGPIGDSGYLVRNAAVCESLEQRLGSAPLPVARALELLDHVLVEEAKSRGLANFDWKVLSRILPSSEGIRFQNLNRGLKDHDNSGESLDIRDLIAGKSPDEVAAIVRDLVVHEVSEILCIGPDRIEPGRSLHDLGMDSLMAVELALGLEQRFGIQLPVMMLNDSPTADKVTKIIVEKLTGNESDAESDRSTVVVETIVRQHGESISPEEVAMLARDIEAPAHNDTRLTA